MRRCLVLFIFLLLTFFSYSYADSLNVDLINSTAHYNSYNMFISGDYAYVIAFSSGFSIFNISNPDTPVEVWSTDEYNWSFFNYYVIDIFVDNDYAYLYINTAFLFSFIDIWDVSNKTSPFKVCDACLPTSGRLSVKDDYLYIVNGDLFVFDVSSPSSPTAVSTTALSIGSDIYVKDDYAYIVGGGETDGELVVVDISNPHSPQIRGSCSTSGYSEIIHITGDYAYILNCDNKKLDIVNIGNIDNPFLITNYSFTDYPMDVFSNNGYAYVSNQLEGLRIIKVNNPCNPIEVGYYNDGMVYYSVFLKDEYIYLVNIGGFEILKYTGEDFCMISGYVKDDSRSPLKDIELVLSGDLCQEKRTLTNEIGYYEFTYLDLSGDFKVKPIAAKPDCFPGCGGYYIFEPREVNFNNIDSDKTQNFTGTLKTSETFEYLMIYPNPCKVYEGNQSITFEGLTKNSKIKIFNINGEEIFEANTDNYEYQWHLINNSNNKISSGIYFALISNNLGGKRIRKIAIIK